MPNNQKSFIYQRIASRLSSFLYRQCNLHPVLYFLVFSYSHYPLEPKPQSFSLILFIFGVTVACVCNFNFLFMLGGFVDFHPLIGVPMFFISLLLCNQKWKVYIFVLSIGDRIFTANTTNHYFLAFFPLLISVQIYRILIFRNLKENVLYFVGMTSISAYYSLTIIADGFKFSYGSWTMLISVIAVASLAYSAISARIERLRRKNPHQIFSDDEMAHYLKMLGEDVGDPMISRIKVILHSKKCHELHCFCHNQQYSGKNEYLLRQLFANALQRFKERNDSRLFESYIDFLLKNEQIINALHFLGAWNPQNYYGLMSHYRCLAKIEHILRDENSSNMYEHQYSYALEYDESSQRVAVEINQVLKLKLHFWSQINRVSPRVFKIQELGYSIIDKMYALNVFYNKVIKRFEKNIYLFDSTAVYAMYMLSTTNFKEYAELIIKNTAKLLEDVYVSENNSSETYAIRSVVKRGMESYIPHPKDSLKIMPSMGPNKISIENYDAKSCKLIIDSVSSGICKILNFRKEDLLDSQLNTIIPDGYKEVHNVRLSYLLDFDSASIRQIVPSKVLHKELKLPIKGANGKLITGFVCIKFQIDIEEGLTFISIIKLTHDKGSHVLMNFEGMITECEEGFNKQILKHSEIARYIESLKDSWRNQKVIREERFNIMISTANYGVAISSPLLGLFLEKENLKEKSPPIHIEIVNEQTNRNRTAENDKHNKIGMQIKHMEKAIYNYDAQSSTNSSKGGSSAVSILTNYSQANSTPLYRFLQLAFLATILCCVISNLGAFFVSQLPWDPTSRVNNPINDTMNLYALQMLTIKSILVLGDQQVYFSNASVMNRTRVSQYFGSTDYKSSVINLTSQLETAYRDGILNIFGSSDVLKDAIEAKLSEKIHLANPAMSPISYQNTTYIDVLMIYATDIILMSQLSLYNTIMSYSFSVEISQAQDVSNISQLIESAVASTEKVSIAVHSTLMIVIVLLIIPLYFLLQKRLSLHEKIFDLLSSIDPIQVANEIQSLEYINNILRNYKQSNEVMKMNVLGYEDNIIRPKVSNNRRRSSAQNEMIRGLEKYDTSNDDYNQSLSSSQISNSKLMVSNLRRESLQNLIQKSFFNNQHEKHPQKRKRPGELELAGSNLDPTKKIRANHCALYLIFLSFLIILGLSLQSQLEFNSAYIKAKDQLFQIYDDQILFQRYLITVKMFLSQGSSYFNSFFGLSNPLQILEPMLQSFPFYDYKNNIGIQTQVIKNCSLNSSSAMPSAFLIKYCQYDYSEVILMGECGAIFKELLELRYQLDNNLSNLNYNSTITSIQEKVYYLQSLNMRLTDLILDKIDLLFEAIIDFSQSYEQAKRTILFISLLWGAISCLIGFLLILRMKVRYFKEVFMITFLNNEMITKNKRVESFLELIAKNTAI